MLLIKMNFQTVYRENPKLSITPHLGGRLWGRIPCSPLPRRVREHFGSLPVQAGTGVCDTERAESTGSSAEATFRASSTASA